MFHAYHSSIVGTKHDICEDYSKKAEFEDCIMMVIADGVGSAELSEVGAKTIVETIINCFSNGYKQSFSDDDSLNLLKNAYTTAYNVILDTAKNENNDKYSYDSTLSVVVITTNYVIWGHCGDGAIFKINKSGDMKKITCEQTGDFSGEVYAFLSGDKYWSFGKNNRFDSYAYIMSTDGILDFLNIVLEDPSDKFIYNILQQIQKRAFENEVCNDLIKQILNLKTISDVTRDDKTLAIVVDDEVSLKPSKDTPNPIVYYGTNNYYINYENEAYETSAFDTVDKSSHNYIINESNSKMVTGIPVSSKVSLMNVFYPLREVEVVLDPSNGTKNAIQLSHYIISRTLCNFKTISDMLLETEDYERNDVFEYYHLDNLPKDNSIKEDFLIEELNDFSELTIKLYLFKDYFLFDFVIPDEMTLSLDFQMWSYSYALANAILKTMRSVKKNISSIPKPTADFIISLRNNLDEEISTE